MKRQALTDSIRLGLLPRGATDNRTIINDCEANTGWTGDDTANPISDAGSFYQGSGALSTQLSNADEQMNTTQDSVGAGTFSLDWSDVTLYLLVKDNLNTSAALGGVQFVIGDGTDLTGYDVGGFDKTGLVLPNFYYSYKLDVSVRVAAPGSFTNYAGTEANLNQAAATAVGYGSLHTAKAVGSTDNVVMDCFRYIANGSYALTIDGGASGTPETMTDVLVDEIAGGWGLVANPKGNQFDFFGPTEWGTPSGTADSYFEASDEQWYLLADDIGVLGALVALLAGYKSAEPLAARHALEVGLSALHEQLAALAARFAGTIGADAEHDQQSGARAFHVEQSPQEAGHSVESLTAGYSKNEVALVAGFQTTEALDGGHSLETGLAAEYDAEQIAEADFGG